jgi:putative lipoic acid-binding regulatory protein
MEEKERKIGYLVTFPDGLTSQQVEELKAALRSAVVSVVKKTKPDDVNVQDKVDDVGWGGKE